MWSRGRLVSQDRICSREDFTFSEGAVYVLHETPIARSLLKQVSVVVCVRVGQRRGENQRRVMSI